MVKLRDSCWRGPATVWLSGPSQESRRLRKLQRARGQFGERGILLRALRDKVHGSHEMIPILFRRTSLSDQLYEQRRCVLAPGAPDDVAARRCIPVIAHRLS